MGKQAVSRPTIILAVVLVAGLFALAIWWRTLPSASAQKFSEGTAQLEQSPEFEKQMEVRKKDRKAPIQGDIPRDKLFQPEVNDR